MIGYKVVRIVDEKRLSAWIGCPELRKYAIEYPKEKTITAPKNSQGLFIFKKRKWAKNFIKGLPDNDLHYRSRPSINYQILKVEYQKTHPIKLCCSGLSFLKNYFKDIDKYKYALRDGDYPIGTLCVRRLKVLT